MDRKNLIKCLAVLAAQYEKFKVLENKMLFDIWFDAFKDEDKMLFEIAVKNLLHTFEYGNPTIANLNHVLADLKNANNPTSGDIYQEIMDHIRYNSCNSSIESLSDSAKEVIKHMGGLKRIGLSESIDYDRTQMLKLAEKTIERSSKDALLTNSMKKEQIENKERMLQLTNNIGKKV